MKKIINILGLVIIFGGLFLFVSKFNRNFNYAIPLIGDEPSYMAMADSLVNFGTFNLKQEVETKHYRNFFIQEGGVDNGVHTVDLGEKQYPKHGIGWSLFLAPLFLLRDNPRILGMIVQNLIVTLLAANIFLWLKEQKYNTWLSVLVSLTIIFTLPIAVQAHMLFSEPLAALCLIYALRYWDRPNILSVIAAAFLPWIHIKYIVFLPFLVWPFFKINFRNFKTSKIVSLRPLIIVAVSVVTITIFNIFAYNTPFSGQEKSSSFFSSFQGLMGIFINQRDGLLPFAPIYILAFLGIGALYRENKKIFWQIVFTSVMLWFITGVFHNWGGGQAPPGRMILITLPVLAPALAIVLKFPLKWIFRTIYLLLLIPSLFLGLRGIWQPITSVSREIFPHLNQFSRAIGLSIDIEKAFPFSHLLGYNLNTLWLAIFIVLLLLGFLVSKYRKKLEKINETINHYPSI